MNPLSVSPLEKYDIMNFVDFNRHQPALTILVQQNPASEAKPNMDWTTLGRWIRDLGNDLMWIGLLGGGGDARCLPNHNRPGGEIRGWAELPDVLELVPTLLAVSCPTREGTVIVRTEV